MDNNIFVVKSDGRKERLMPEKYMLVCVWGCEDVAGTSASDLSLRAYSKIYDGITTRNLHEILIKTAVEMIDEEVNYDIVAAKLLNFLLRKDVYKSYEVPSLYSIVTKNTANGKYSKDLLDNYTKEEFDEMDSFIKHDRDNNFTYSAMMQLRGKYLVQDRSTGEVFETPQITYMLIAATLHMNENKKDRMQHIKNYYNSQSLKKHSIPTPIAAGCRTPTKQFSSCVLIGSGDSLASICEAGTTIVKYVSKKAGIGLHVGNIRGIGSKVGDGVVSHTGLIPFMKKFKGDLKSCSQGGVRSAAATLFYPWWHYEYPELIVLKNNAGTEVTRERSLDYGVELSKNLINKYQNNEDVYLFSPNDVPDMRDAFYSGDFDKFNNLYEQYSKDPDIRKRKVTAEWLLETFVIERQKTGRIYGVFMENFYKQSPFNEKAFEDGSHLSSNLCLEIGLPVKASMPDNSGLVALCTLSSCNLGKAKTKEDLEMPLRISVRALDNLLSYQEYPSKEAENFTKKYRPLGVGVVGLAHFFAKRDLKYDKNSAEILDEYMEAFMYYLIDESVRLAEEKGACEGYKNTCYGQGKFAWELRNPNVDKIVKHKLRYDWEELRQRMVKFGIRNATLSAIAPTESSSQLLGETNGIEPPRKAISRKASKEGILKQVIPEYRKLKNKYDYLWDQKSPVGYLTLVAVMQKWVDQSISTNTSYDPKHFPDEKLPMSILIRDIVYAMNIGVKTLYYFNTNDEKTLRGDSQDDEDSQLLDEEVDEVMSEQDCCTI